MFWYLCPSASIDTHVHVNATGSLRILEVGKAPGSGIPWHACTGLSTLIAIISVGFAYMSLGTQEKACTLEEYMG